MLARRLRALPDGGDLSLTPGTEAGHEELKTARNRDGAVIGTLHGRRSGRNPSVRTNDGLITQGEGEELS
jgi:hypothetical protein